MNDKIREQIAELRDSGTVGIGINYAAADTLQSLLDERDKLALCLERCGIDSSAVLAGQDDGTWQDENDRLKKQTVVDTAVIRMMKMEKGLLEEVVEAAKGFINNHMDHDDAMLLVTALAKLENSDE